MDHIAIAVVVSPIAYGLLPMAILSACLHATVLIEQGDWAFHSVVNISALFIFMAIRILGGPLPVSNTIYIVLGGHQFAIVISTI